jgi:hypothetical protein
MKKLRLDDLSVESFNTTEIKRERGTVVGEQQCTCYTVCTCPGCPTCDATCAYTCDDATCLQSCNGTCQEWTCQESCGGTCWNPRCQGNSYYCP